MKPYPKYKESGGDWLGKVPEHWEIKRLGGYFFDRKEKVSDTIFKPLSVTKNGIVPLLDNAAKTDNGDNRKKVCIGDFGFCRKKCKNRIYPSFMQLMNKISYRINPRSSYS